MLNLLHRECFFIVRVSRWSCLLGLRGPSAPLRSRGYCGSLVVGCVRRNPYDQVHAEVGSKLRRFRFVLFSPKSCLMTIIDQEKPAQLEAEVSSHKPFAQCIDAAAPPLILFPRPRFLSCLPFPQQPRRLDALPISPPLCMCHIVKSRSKAQSKLGE